MILLPAIDVFEGRAVRLYKGDYNQMTVYNDSPARQACIFRDAGASYLHVVDLEGARDGTTPNFDTIVRIVRESGLPIQVGGGIRSLEVIEKYLDAGIARVILGTAALTDPDFLAGAAARYGDKIAVGVDILDGFVAIRGWTEVTETKCLDFMQRLVSLGIKTVICTDISKDGVLGGANHGLYRELSETLPLDIIASGGVATLEDIAVLTKLGLYGTILGKSLYTGSIDLAKALALVQSLEGTTI
jgi:phosphoribosylformimino-5-aminoimidazole carboxamide ribotide isomerase